MDFQKLSEYVGEIYINCSNNRKDFFEVSWERSYNAFHRIDNSDVWKAGEAEGWRSDTYIDITKQKITAGVNLVNGMLFKNGDIPFELQDPMDMSGMPTADDSSMEMLISNQLKEGGAAEGLEATILSGGIYGDGFARTYIDPVKEVNFEPVENNFVEVYQEIDYRRVENVSVWDMFWDIEADDFRNAKHVFERKYLTKSDLKKIRDNDEFVRKGAIDRAIMQVGAEDYTDTFDQSDSPKLRDIANRTRTIRYLECWLEYEDDYIFCAVCGNEIVKFTSVDRSDMPYYRFRWERNCDNPRSIGIAENVNDLQKVINGSFRTFEDNKKLSGNNVFVGQPSVIKNLEDGIEPGKVLLCDDTVDNIAEAFGSFQIPDVGDSLLSVVNLSMQLADSASNIPRTSQGQESSNPQTAYEIQQRLERAGKYIGQVIVSADKFLEPIIARFYALNMIDPNIPMEIKYPARIKVKGFESYESKVLRSQKLMQTMQLFSQDQQLHDKFNSDWIISEIVKSNDINPKLVLKSPEQLQQEAEAAQAAQAKQDEMYELEKEKLNAEIQKLYAERDSIIEKNQLEEEKNDIQREKIAADSQKQASRSN